MNTTGEVRETGGQSVSSLEGPGAVSVTVNVAGQSLDDARAEFREAWQARLDRTKRRAARAAKSAADLNRAGERIPLAGMLCGAVVGTLVLLARGGMGGVLTAGLFGMTMGGLLGLTVVIPVVALVQVSAWLLERYAARQERAVYESERL